MTDEDFRSLPKPGVNGSGRTLPHSLEAEERLLSCCMYVGDEGAVLEKAIRAKIGQESFYDPKHGIIYAQLVQMRAENKPVEPGVLAEELKTSHKLDAIGGWAFVAQVSQASPTTAESAYLVNRVLDLATRREIIRTATLAVEECHTSTDDLATLTSNLTRRLTFAVEGRRDDQWPAIISAADFCARPPVTPPTLISGLMYETGTMLIAGPSKAHKTFAALDAAIAVACGEPWLGFKTVASPVLYLNLELQDFATSDRLTRISSARGHKPPPGLHIWNLRGRTVDLAALTSHLPAAIKQTGAKLVAIDPHYKISSVSGMEESSNDDQGKLLTLMEGLCHQAGAALVLTHHFAKGDASAKNAMDRASGAGTFTRWPDAFCTFTPHEEEDAMTIDFFLRNFAPVESFVVRWEYPRWQRDSALNPANLQRKPGSFTEKFTAATLLESLGNDMLTAKEWEAKSGFTHATFHRKRAELVASNRVVLSANCYTKR